MFKHAMRFFELWEGELKAMTLDGRAVLLLRRGDEVRAFADRCPHQGVALSEGKLQGDVLTCAAHSWQFDADTGRGLNPEGCQLTRYDVRIEDGEILVDLPELVGPVLQPGPATAGIVAAIRELNPAASVVDRGSYLRVLAPSPCFVTRAAIERKLGRAIGLGTELEAAMPSFKGRFELSESEAKWI